MKIPFCKVPFLVGYPVNDGRFRDCCVKHPSVYSDRDQTFEQWWQGPQLTEFRSKLWGTEFPKECWSCEVMEKQGERSLRMNVNEWPETNYDHPMAWNIYFGNTCNLACWSCNETLSSVTYRHKLKIGMITEPDSITENFEQVWPGIQANILKSYDHHDTVTLTLLGGEPLYNPIVNKFLHELMDRDLAMRTKLEFHTNGTQYPDRMLPMDKKVWKYICMFISLDATGNYAEWLRYGCKWPMIENNIDRLKKASDYTEIHCTLSVLNINYLHDLEQWAEQQDVKLKITPTGYPDYIALKHWDQPIDKLLVKDTHIKYQQYYDIIGTEPKTGSSEKIKQYIRKFDSVRKPLSDFDPVFAEQIGW